MAVEATEAEALGVALLTLRGRRPPHPGDPRRMDHCAGGRQQPKCRNGVYRTSGEAMTDRADELALRVLETCSHGISDYDDNYGPCLRCTADALRAYAEEARREEREACCEDVCTRCANGSTPEHQSDPRPMWWHEASRCSAAATRARGGKHA